MKNNAIVQSFFKEGIDGIETVKAYSIENEIKKKSISKFKTFIDSIVKNSFLAMSQDVLSDAVELVGTMIVLWVGFSMVLSGQFKTGLLITYYVLIGYFTGPIKNLIQLQPVIQKALWQEND